MTGRVAIAGCGAAARHRTDEAGRPYEPYYVKASGRTRLARGLNSIGPLEVTSP
jgi:hypothetical protein